MARTVLVADDSPTIQKKAQGILKGEGFEVETVSNGVAAIKKLAKLSPVVVLADVSMPGKDGYEVCDFVKHSEALQHVPVLLIASDLEPYDEDKGARVRADGKITKPFEPDELIATVSKLAALAESATATPAPEAVTAPPEPPPPMFEIAPAEEPDVGAKPVVPSFGPFSEGVAFAEPGPEETLTGLPQLDYTPPPPVEVAPAEPAVVEPSVIEPPPVEEPAVESPFGAVSMEAPPEETAIPSEPILVEEPVAETPELDAIPESEQTLVFRTPAQIAEPVLKDETAPPVEEPPPPVPEFAEPTPLTTSSLDTFTLSEAAAGEVSIAPPEPQAEMQPEPEAPPISELAPAEIPPEVATAAPEEPSAAVSAPEEPGPAHPAVDPGLVLAIVQKTVSKMSPPALPPQIAEEIARKLADEILGELDAGPPQAL